MQLNELYCLEQLGEAVDRLAAGAGSLPERFEEARLVLLWAMAAVVLGVLYGQHP